MAEISLDYISAMKIGHGVLAALAWVIFFPAGAISIRLLPGRYALMVHTISQIFGYVLFTAAVGMGIHLAIYLKKAGADLLPTHHPIIGLVLFSLLFFQVILGYVHHLFFKKYQRRTVWAHAHMWLGRILITLGIINGGLGLRLASNYGDVMHGEIVYGVVAGVVWLVYVAAAVYGEIKKPGTPKGQGVAKTGSSSDHSTAEDVEGGVITEKPATTS